MYDLVPDSTFSFKRGGEKSSEKCASRPLCATTDSTGHASRCIVRSGVQRGGHPGPYGPIATISDPGPFPGEGKGLKTYTGSINFTLTTIYKLQGPVIMPGGATTRPCTRPPPDPELPCVSQCAGFLAAGEDERLWARTVAGTGLHVCGRRRKKVKRG